jgi:hypothetical protein
VGHPLKADQRVRVALGYTSSVAVVAGIAGMSSPKLLPKWALERIDGLTPSATAGAVVLALLTFAATSLLHYLLLSLFAPSNGGAAAAKPAH